jgi:nucleoside-diphosphate-sugar epimerase
MHADEPSATLVTGASGFLGRTVSATLATQGVRVVRAGRRPATGGSAEWIAHGPLGRHTDWSAALQGVSKIVHLAGIAHLSDAASHAAREEIYEVNARGTERLARCAAERGIARFVFVSSALVHGSHSGDRPIRENDPLCPVSAYARSKLAAEQLLAEIACRSGMEFVILRPPMVYGPGAGGNFRRLCNAIGSGWPLPLGRARAPRSFLGVGNLADAVATCLQHAAAANRAFLVCDQEVSSTADLIDVLAKAMRRRVVNAPIPRSVMQLALAGLGKRQDFARLFAPFALSTAEIADRLSWRPPNTFVQGIYHAVDVEHRIEME